MVALVYHPAYDPYGSVLRSLRFLRFADAPLLSEQVRLYDFLMLFPEFIAKFRLTAPLRARFKRTDYRSRFRYEERPSAERLFSEMGPTFDAAFQTLRADGLVRMVDSASEMFQINASAVPASLGALIETRNAAEGSLLSFLLEMHRAFPFFGPNGLKARSGLLEFRYDVI